VLWLGFTDENFSSRRNSRPFDRGLWWCIVSVQCVRKCCWELENCRTYVHEGDRTDRTKIQRRLWTQHDNRNWFWKTDWSQFEIYLPDCSCLSELHTTLSMKSCDPNSQIATATEILNSYQGRARKVAGSIHDDVGIFHWHNPSGLNMALGSTQPLTEIITRDISWEVKAAGA
jgi:hypothetical protein